MKLIEIFNSIEGEGVRAGQLCTFIRLANCNLRCSYCDTSYSYNCPDIKEMNIPEIIKIVESYKEKTNCYQITITGGEPLLQLDISELVNILLSKGFKVNIETNGSINIMNILPWKTMHNRNLMLTVDYKLPSSGMDINMCHHNFEYFLSPKDVLKFVIGDKEDLNAALQVINKFEPSCQIYFSPVWGKIQMSEIVDFMKEHKLSGVKLQVQLHKIIWNPDERGV